MGRPFVAIWLLAAVGAPAVAKEGMSLSVGAGLNGFRGDRMTSATEAGGSWDLRFVLGTRAPVGLELAYVGTAHRIGAVGMDQAILLSSGFEAALRLHFADGAWQPYFLAGVASKHYDLEGAERNTSDLRGTDDVLELPFGIGLAWRWDGMVVDARAIYHPAAYTDLVSSAGDERGVLDNYDLSARIGVEF